MRSNQWRRVKRRIYGTNRYGFECRKKRKQDPWHDDRTVITMKLVRDKIPEMIMKQGKTVQIRVANDAEYEMALIKKIQEEVAEFIHDRSEGEIADIEEALRCYAELRGFDWDAIEMIRRRKNEERGSFKKRIILEQTI